MISLYVLISFICEFMCFEKILKIFVCKINLKDLKIPKFYSIEYENFSKFYQTQINEKYLSEKWIIKN